MSRHTFVVRASGQHACFSQPQYNQERFSYDVATPVALEGMLKAVFWRHGVEYVIERISVLSPIRRVPFRRNEVETFGPVRGDDDNHTQRLTSLLRDVDYRIEFHIEAPTREDTAKANAMFERYMNKGKQFSQPYFGCREWSADVRWADNACPKPIQETRALGRMVYGYVWDDVTSQRKHILEFDAVMRKGVIDVPPRSEVLRKCGIAA